MDIFIDKSNIDKALRNDSDNKKLIAFKAFIFAPTLSRQILDSLESNFDNQVVTGGIVDYKTNVPIIQEGSFLYKKQIYNADSKMDIRRDIYERWRNGDGIGTGEIEVFSNNRENGNIIDPLSLQPISSPDDKMASFLIGMNIYSGESLKQLITNSSRFKILPDQVSREDFISTFINVKISPMLWEPLSVEQLGDLYDRILEGAHPITPSPMDVERTLRSGLTGGRSKKRKSKKRKSKMKKSKKRKTKKRKSKKLI